MPLRLYVVEGADKGRFFMLPEAGEVTIGSSRKNAEIALNDLYVARLHCQLEIAAGKIVLTDHDSPSGTLVNNQKVKDVELSKGDVIRMGNTQLRLEDAGVAAADEDVPEIDAEVLPEVEVEVLSEEAEAPETVTDVVADSKRETVAKPAAPPAPSAPAAKLPRLAREDLHKLTGHVLAHFQVGHMLVRGFHGAVFQAQNQKDGKWVALKVLAPDFPANEAEMERFTATVKKVLLVRHPNLVGIHGVGKTGPYCWIAMEHVDSDSLPDVIGILSRVRNIEWRLPYRVALHIGRALQCAHEHKIFHANITPRSILWQARDKVAKLADLGLASALQGSVLRKNVLREKIETEIFYMAPEQTQPGRFVDGFNDVYSLAVVVYALSSGHLPFVGASQAETLRKIRDAAPVPLSHYQPEIPPQFEKVILKALAKTRTEGYQSPAEFLADLQQVPQAQEIEA